MKRRDFFKKGAAVAAASSVSGIVLSSCSSSQNIIYDKTKDRWFHLGNGKSGVPNRKETKAYEVAVVGGGAAGICAAVASARNGTKTVLIQDRPVLGGNASSEMRVHLNGVNNIKGKAE
ncbi:FAD-dependent oxidoreductase, partial [Flavobacteriaceae bacterium]|nr:FAD-dependent oxidoreductase [Flavobacteriaceae bacterium]